MKRFTRLAFLLALVPSVNAFADIIHLINDPVRTVAAGSFGGQISFQVTDDIGNWVPGAHYQVATDPSCGAFYVDGYPSVFDGFANYYGGVNTPAFFGVAPSTSCPWTLTVDNVPGVLNFPMHVFSYAAIVMTPSSPVITATSDQGYAVEFHLSESGLPLVAQTVGVMTAVINPNRNGATAVPESPNPYTYDDVMGKLFDANSKQGDYSITFTICCGGPTMTMPVSQRHK